jgi:hypothetical protein
VKWALASLVAPEGFEADVELTARAIQSFGEEAGRMVLIDPEQYSPERYERFVTAVMRLVWPAR